MPIIPNFPAALLEEHRLWHHTNHHSNPANLPPGYGEKFLQFHRQYIAKALQWYERQGYDMRLVAPWQEVPEEIRSAPCYDRNAEMRIRNNPESFATADELGLFLEASNLHGCIHETAAKLYGQPDLNDFDLAPANTIFYNIHSMIDQWYQNWERAKGMRLKNAARNGGASVRAAGKAGRPGSMRAASGGRSKSVRRSAGGKLPRKAGGKLVQSSSRRQSAPWHRPARNGASPWRRQNGMSPQEKG